jgi:CRP-like cAMP-binding protein
MDSFWGNIFKGRKKGGEEIRDVIRKVPIFDGLSNRELSAIELNLHRRQYREGEVIFRRGDPAMGMFIIMEGTVEIQYDTADRVLAELHDGEFFGELALLDESPRSATATARTGCRMLGFFQSDLFGLTERNPRLGIKILLLLARIIGERLKISNEQFQSLQNELNALRKQETG